MVEKFNGYKSKAGGLFLSEEAAVRDEVISALCEIIPEFQMVRARLEAQLDAVAVAVGPMVDYRRRVPLKPAIGAEAIRRADEEEHALRQRRTAAMERMQDNANQELGREWLTRNGFENLRDFGDRATDAHIADWRSYLSKAQRGQITADDLLPVDPADICNCAASPTGSPLHHHRDCPVYRAVTMIDHTAVTGEKLPPVAGVTDA